MSDQPYRIVGLGEILWDVFPEGARLGGAPANFASHAASLGGERVNVSIISSVGDDELGQNALERLSGQGLDTSLVERSERPTGRVLVSLDEDGKATYDFAADSAWDRLQWNESLRKLASRSDAVCFGSLGQRSDVSRNTIQRFVATMAPDSIRVFDINIRPPFVDEAVIKESLRLANVLKLNDEELGLLAEMFDVSASSDQAMLEEIAERFDLTAAALTQGANGSLLIRGNEISKVPAVQTTVVDTVGAGDSFTATLVLGLLRQCSLDAINSNATEVAAFVCTQSGATPDLPDDLRETVRQRC